MTLLLEISSILETADPISLVQSSTVGYSWGSSVSSSVFQTKTDEYGILIAHSLFRDF
jgi:hypothetical protein